MTHAHRDYFNQMAPKWDSLLADETLERLKRIIAELNIKAGSAVLDVGTGTGVLLPFLLEAVGPQGRLVALDVAEEMLARARAKMGDRVEYVCADITRTSLESNAFDEIICNSCFPHLVDKLGALREMVRLLKPGGRLVICHPMSREAVNELHRSIGGVVANDMLPSEEEMRELCLKAGLVQVGITNTPEKYLLTAYKPLGGDCLELVPIGVIHSPYRSTREAPHQGRFSDQVAELEIYSQYAEGLKDVEQVTHLIVLYWCHLARRDVLQTKTPHGPEIRGVFACRSPSRPNPLAFCVAELVEVKENRLLVRGLDAVDGSPLIDIKPYSADLDSFPGARIGWFKK